MDIAEGDHVAFRHPELSWVLGQVKRVEQKGTGKAVFWCTDGGLETAVPSVKEGGGWRDLYRARADLFEEEPDDLLKLTELHEATLLHCLRRRFERDVVYTNIGTLIVAFNPFKKIPRYQPENALDVYLAEGPTCSGQVPHVWTVAHQSYHEMVGDRADQTILISGESGSGKTVGAKIVLDYLTAVSCQRASLEQRQATEQVGARLRAASPILESFGNAKTVRNDNSSRFGKFMRIQFDASGYLVGAHTTKYLLEKSRILEAAHIERVYHIFYQVLTDPRKVDYGLREGPGSYRNTKSGGCASIDGVDDAADYRACRDSMTAVGITASTQESILHAAAGIMLLQCVQFGEQEDAEGNKRAFIDEANKKRLGSACAELRIDAERLGGELCTTKTVTRGDTVHRPLSAAKACDVRDSVAKQLYDRLFQWLVDRINATTDRDSGGGKSEVVNFLGLLDIFGFEQFKKNSFEQFCINLANEQLQGHYNAHVFVEDINECQREGISTEAIDFADNQPTLDLMMAPRRVSILSLLDESSNLQESDEQFLAKCNERFSPTGKGQEGHESYARPKPVRGNPQEPSFIIKHYAGEVCYSVTGWIEKNREPLKDEVRLICRDSTDPLVKDLLAPPEQQKKGGGSTVGGFFRTQLAELLLQVNRTNPHWIRCIKPHPAKQPRMWEPTHVMEQLASAGVVETVRVRRAGYPIRYKLQTFAGRFRALFGGAAGGTTEQLAAGCAAVLKKCEVTAAGGQVGKTKVFLRAVGLAALTKAREAAELRHIAKLQRTLRGLAGRGQVFLLHVKSHRAELEQSRAEEARIRALRAAEERRQQELHEAKRQRELKEQQEREELMHRDQSRAATAIQRVIRGVLVRATVQREMAERMRSLTERHVDELLERQRAQMHDVERRRLAAELRAAQQRRREQARQKLLLKVQEHRAAKEAIAASPRRERGAAAARGHQLSDAELIRRMAEQQREERAQRAALYDARREQRAQARAAAAACSPGAHPSASPARSPPSRVRSPMMLSAHEVAAKAVERFERERRMDAVPRRDAQRSYAAAFSSACRRADARTGWVQRRGDCILQSMQREQASQRRQQVLDSVANWAGCSAPPRPGIAVGSGLTAAERRAEAAYQQKLARELELLANVAPPGAGDAVDAALREAAARREQRRRERRSARTAAAGILPTGRTSPGRRGY